MIKTIVYTSNPTFFPTTLAQVENFASDNDKYYVCYADSNSQVGKLKEGAHVVTSKGNNVFVLDVYDEQVEAEYAKKCNITNIISVDYPFATKKSATKNSMKSTNLTDKLKNQFMSTKAEGIRMTMNGELCVETPEGYVSIDKDNKLTSYPEEMTIDVPVYTLVKPKDQLKAGDIIAVKNSYAKVLDIKEDKIYCLSYTGTNKTVHSIKDVLFNQSTVRVVMSFNDGQINPMMFALLSEDKDSLLPFLMMNNGGNVNPMMYMLLAKKDDSSLKDILMMQALTGQNPFAQVNKD